MDNSISARRVAGFIALTLAILVGTVALAFLLSAGQPAATPQATASPGAEPSPTGSSLPSMATASPTERPGASSSPGVIDPDAPGGSGRIPSFVPIPSGPVP